VLGPGGFETWRGGNLRRIAACAELFKKHADEIDGIIITLPNFGEERGIVDAIRLSGLKVPVLVQATPDRSDAMTIATRRDSFCGKMSACNNLMQYGIPYSLTTLHTEALTRPSSRPIWSGSPRSAAS
jgi:L-fucose isomerase-like protein